MNEAMVGKTVERNIERNSIAYRELMKAIFTAVCNPDDWKAPIDCRVPNNMRDLTIEAIEYVAGVKAQVVSETTIDVRIKCVGYRMGPCGDY